MVNIIKQEIEIEEKETNIDNYLKTYPGIKIFLDNAVAHAKEQGYVVTLFGL